MVDLGLRGRSWCGRSQCLNGGLLGKWWWKLLNGTDHLWNAFVGVHNHKRGPIWNTIRCLMPHFWKSVLRVKDNFFNSSSFLSDDARSTRFLLDRLDSLKT